MFLLIPVLLGFLIPKVNERITKKKFLERQAAEQAKAQTTVAQAQSVQPKNVQIKSPLSMSNITIPAGLSSKLTK